ncbi:hypothetical protein, no similarity [Maudiozyma saulgeensis]|uniref:Uncharacterized protein n=1 Tax=Maudiozyma saulgeensis TaxID=1789683 RepID=A0A1X7R772_9SACH|nr:hypothetical protein, no similarity [Kazachstania saulgeensis]
MEYSGLIQEQQRRVSDGEINVQMNDGIIKERPLLSVQAVSSDTESLVDDITENTLFNDHDQIINKNSIIESRPLSKDDMLLLPPLPQTFLPSTRQSSIVSVTEMESFEINNSNVLPSLNDLECDKSVDYTLQDLSKALEISDISSRVHSRNVSMSSLSSMTKSNSNINIKTNYGMTSSTSTSTMSSPVTMPSFSFGSNTSSSTNTSTDLSRNNSNPMITNKRFFPISLTRQNSLTIGNSTNTNTNTNTITSTKIKSRSRSLSNSNIFRKLSLGNIKPTSIPEVENTTTTTTTTECETTIHHQRLMQNNKLFIIGNITTIKELTKKFEKVNFNNNEIEQEKYIHKLIELQKKDDMLFDIIIKKITKDNWSSKEEINDLKLQRIKLNELWAKKINYYQNL